MTAARALTRRERAGLWFAFLGPPAAWTLHLLLGYGAEEAACSTGLDDGFVEPWVAAITVALGGATVATGLAGLRAWRAARGGAIADPRGRVAFMAFAGMAGSALFGATILLGGIQILFLDPCAPS